MIKLLENVVFGLRFIILAGLLGFTVVTGFYATQLRMDAGFDKQLPIGHEYIQTFQEYREQLFGSNRIIVVMEANQGTIWTKEFFKVYKDLTDDIFFLPGVARHTVTSLWTPNTRYIEITEEGISADDVISGKVTADSMTEQNLMNIQNNVIRGGFVGRLVADDFHSAMVVAELQDYDPSTQARLDYFDLAAKLEAQIRQKYEDEDHTIRIIGFAKLIGDIADGAGTVVVFFFVAFVLTALAVYLYSRSVLLTGATLFASLTSVVWQFGLLNFLGYGLDPLAVLVPFLVFAIGVSHGVQQINVVTAEISNGADAETAARTAFSRLFIPGSMALITTLVSFATLYLIPVPMIRELAITASIGVILKVATNLVMLPLLVSYLKFDDNFVHRVQRSRAVRLKIMTSLGFVANRKVAPLLLAGATVLFVIAVSQAMNRHVGALHAGAPELRPDARYNVDSTEIANSYALGLNVLIAVVETPPDACVQYPYVEFLNRFSWHMQNVPDITLVVSLPFAIKGSAAGWNEGNLKWKDIPRNRPALAQASNTVPGASALYNQTCTILPHYFYLRDSKATTIKAAIAAIEQFRNTHEMEGVTIRLASGNMGVQAAVNQEITETELPMIMWVYAVIIALVALTYRDWRAVIACCLPLTFGTFFGYWFMEMLQIGLTVATLPVMVLAVGIGVDYAYYIYNRVPYYLGEGLNISDAFRQSLLEAGMATFFTALTLAVGVSTWAFSDLKFQADMGLLLSFMFMVNMVMAVTVLPALAVTLEMLFPRSRPVAKMKNAPVH
ncbi:MAG: MMPL family transporter [Parvibaculum sp.]|uniref:efflux RND transporter permease subunit n=1 Tax=Parvibaculum sp. TaxID=2024848 RepID=UPI001DDE8D61|nr:MMPL family transporter [Parvibaculum sp.]MBX3489894.1 MMPL family transporter [Parvibaculum sp.]MBX3494938.1 MMPL family transporter [Parvibaculum sp.]MCW5726118.1 MMPL family transporter [Parvibaculum sp.]